MKDVVLTVAAPLLKDGELRLPYTVSNHSGEPVFLLNLYEDREKLLRPPPRTEWSAELAPTCYLAAEQVVVVWAGALPRPARPGFSYFASYTPLASRLGPGEVFRAVLRFELPVIEWNPYAPPSSDAKIVEPTKVSKVRVIVDVLREKDARVKDPVKKSPGAFQAVGSPVERLTVETTLDTPVMLLRRKDADFTRIVPSQPPPPPNAPPGWKPDP